MAKQIRDTHCNFCGSKLTEWDLQEDLKIETILGFGSYHDGSEIKLRFCCDCFDKIIDCCAVNPIVREVL